MQRGFVLLLIAFSVAATIAFSLGFSRYLESMTRVALPGAIALGTIFGGALLWTGVQVHKDVGRRIDRAFFRTAYDARVVMEQLLSKIRTVTNRDELQPYWSITCEKRYSRVQVPCTLRLATVN